MAKKMKKADSSCSMKPEDVRVTIKALKELRPLLDGSSGAYLGIYDGPAKRICDVFGWDHIRT